MPDRDTHPNKALKTLKTCLAQWWWVIKTQWPHAVLLVPALVGVTVLHELGHAVMVWLQGGYLLEFAWWPSAGEWGHVQYNFPEGVSWNRPLIALGPYLFWVLSIVVAGALALFKKQWPVWLGSTVLVWLCLVPAADIANAAVGHLVFRADNDFYTAFGPANDTQQTIGVLLLVLFVGLVFVMQQRLLGTRRLHVPAFASLVVLALGVFAALM